jgi:hypothetical protein
MLARTTPLITFAVCGLIAVHTADAAVVQLQAQSDNTLFDDPAGSLSNGAGSYLFAGTTNALTLRRALLLFDVSSIPAGSTINSVGLRVRVSRSASAAEICTIHPVLASWGEGSSSSDGAMGGGGGIGATANDATWTQRFFGSTTPWDAPGGDFEPDASATLALASVGTYTFTSSRMAADVTAWLNDPSSNFGYMIRGNEADAGTAKRIDSSENATLANRPVLVIDYTPIPTPGLAILPVAATYMLGDRRRATSGLRSSSNVR